MTIDELKAKIITPELKHCKVCNQMTNHGCQKCAFKLGQNSIEHQFNTIVKGIHKEENWEQQIRADERDKCNKEFLDLEKPSKVFELNRFIYEQAKKDVLKDIEKNGFDVILPAHHTGSKKDEAGIFISYLKWKELKSKVIKSENA